MQKIAGATFEDSMVVLDGNEYKGCDFRRCKIVFTGKAPVQLIQCNFSHCVWQLGGGAFQTLAFFETMYGQPGFRSIVESFFAMVRTGKFINPDAPGRPPPPPESPPPSGRRPRRRR